jgi:homocitrate synthase NifV
MALANTVEMLKSGCLWADTSLCGIGERAGNCDFYDLIRVTNHLFDFGITPEAAAAAQRAFRDILGEISP